VAADELKVCFLVIDGLHRWCVLKGLEDDPYGYGVVAWAWSKDHAHLLLRDMYAQRAKLASAHVPANGAKHWERVNG
jgi:hypothetical protein